MVETGQTLRENGLIEMERIFDITSRLIANRVSYRMKNSEIQAVCDALSTVIKGASV
ncbi:ATP phosphoribosyltransferase [compost metagenome]